MSTVCDLTGDGGAGTGGVRLPFCPACKKQLCGPLVASKCRHVFHKACLTPELHKCPRCNKGRPYLNALDLFGVCFDDARFPSGFQLPGSTQLDTPGTQTVEDSEADRRIISEIHGLKSKLREQQSAPMQDIVAKLTREYEKLDKEKEHLTRSQKEHTKLNNSCMDLQKRASKLREEHEGLCGKMDQIRQRDTVLDYMDLLKTKSEAEALSFLTKMVTMVPAPWKILVKVGRERDEFRTRLDAWQKDSLAAGQHERQFRAKLSERSRRITELERELSKLEHVAAKRRKLAAEKSDAAPPPPAT